MILEDLQKIKTEGDKMRVREFIHFVNDNYVPAAKKVALTDEMLKEGELKRTITLKFTRIFHVDKNVNEPRQVQILREEIMKWLNTFMENLKEDK